ncbi:hypothetical protein DFO66_10779 [Brevibacterium sanguinis]|uniref:Uncharacterized protein n=2 Tax=Brevibacterium TaxID=1696 RepID=A0A366IKR1_9MICO|nr:hypothetical protein DFO66_10779 [Brevibacterium sanguinis]RBP71505.1 hypothetical protein DFO65_105105 [Brevibacterium celere]
MTIRPKYISTFIVETRNLNPILGLGHRPELEQS